MNLGKSWAPKVDAIIEKRTMKSYSMELRQKSWSRFMYEVRAKEGKKENQKWYAYQVQVLPPNRLTCECQKPDLTGIPCGHVIAVLGERDLDVKDYVSQYYSAEYQFRTWQPMFEPAGNIEAWPVYNGAQWVPDPTKVKRGRRKHHRMPMTMDEMHKQMNKRKNKCSRCGVLGHNKKKCRAPFAHETNQPTPRSRPANAHILNEFLPGNYLFSLSCSHNNYLIKY